MQMFTEPNKLSMGRALLVVTDAADEVVLPALLELAASLPAAGVTTGAASVTVAAAVVAGLLLLAVVVVAA